MRCGSIPMQTAVRSWAQEEVATWHTYLVSRVCYPDLVYRTGGVDHDGANEARFSSWKAVRVHMSTLRSYFSPFGALALPMAAVLATASVMLGLTEVVE